MWLVTKLKKLKHLLLDRFEEDSRENAINYYKKLFDCYAFVDGKCHSKEQFEASIVRLYHTLEKGLAYGDNYKPGFGRANVDMLIATMQSYSKMYDINTFFYQTALSCLHAYLEKNQLYGIKDTELMELIEALPGKANHCGGIIDFTAPCSKCTSKMNYEELVTSRHSIRHFSREPVEIKTLEKAISLSQYTPSACNRQGWKTRIIADKNKLSCILENQNGNRGFGHEIDKLLIISCDIRFFQRNREFFQVFIDGGMYAENLINSLYFYGIGSIPLSASLLKSQSDKIKQIVGIHEAEQIILFLGVGNYPEKCLTTRSERKPASIELH